MKFKFREFLREAFWNDKKYTCIKAGRRTGKTYNAVIWIVANLLSKPGKTGLWVDTAQANLEKYIDRYFRPILQDQWTRCKYNRQKHILHFPNGSYLDMASAERPANAEGQQYDYIVLNEAGIILKKPDLWLNSIMPMCKDGIVKIIGTPKGKNLFHQLYHQQDEEWASYTYTAYDSPEWKPEALDKIKVQVPQEVWEQEYMATFVEGAGSVFRNIRSCYLPESYKNYQVKSGQEYIMGVDIAKHTDYTVIYVAEKNTRHIIFQDRFNQIDWTLQKQRIINTWTKYNKPATWLDSTGVGDAIYDDLRSQGMHNLNSFKFTQSSKQELIHNLSVAIENQEIKFIPFDELVGELETFEYTVSNAGLFRYSAPEGLHDDCVMALGLVNHGLRNTFNLVII